MSITKHLRLSIDFTIAIADTPPLLPEGSIEPPDPDYDTRQARLLEAIKNKHEVFALYMRDLIAQELDGKFFGYWEEALMGGEKSYLEMIGPVLETLPPEDQEYFNEIIGYEGRIGYAHFEDVIDMVIQSFAVEMDKPVIREPEWEQAMQRKAEHTAYIQALEQELASPQTQGKKAKARQLKQLLDELK